MRSRLENSNWEPYEQRTSDKDSELALDSKMLVKYGQCSRMCRSLPSVSALLHSIDCSVGPTTRNTSSKFFGFKNNKVAQPGTMKSCRRYARVTHNKPMQPAAYVLQDTSRQTQLIVRQTGDIETPYRNTVGFQRFKHLLNSFWIGILKTIAES